MTAERYGRGVAYPVTVTAVGAIGETAGIDKIEQSIRIILGTGHGERAMRPTFGCNLASLAFAPNTSATANLARHYAESGLRRWEPRIEVLDVTVRNDLGTNALTINIGYRVKGASELRTLVFPFALEPPS